MGLFDKGVDPADFEKYKKWVSEALSALEGKIASTANESAVEAEAAAKVALSAKARIEAIEPDIYAVIEDIKKAKTSIAEEVAAVSASRTSFEQEVSSLHEKSEEAISLFEKMRVSVDSAGKAVEEIDEDLSNVNGYLEEAKNIPEALEALKKQVGDANSQGESIRSLLSHSLKRKADLDELHKEVFGHNVEDSDGNIERIDGLKDQLEATYDGISEKLDSLGSKAEDAIKKVSMEHDQIRREQGGAFEDLINRGISEVDSVVSQLKALLPGGLAAGLSAAYESKKDEEVSSLASHERNFRMSIYGLVAVSMIPFSIDVYLLVNGASLEAVLKETPKIVMSILPLYFPVLWLAYSANKRFNLSKRLIEEYTHKAVLGKTFSGLSNQIETLPNESAVKEELRTRLLFNVLQVSSENPGKLITDYAKSDHPFMDVLEKSAKLSESVETLSKIPGLSGIAKKLAERRDVLLREQEAKVNEGLAANDEIEEGGKVRDS